MTDKKVSYIKKNSNSSMDWSVVETLRALADEIEAGEVNYNRCFISLLDDVEPGTYNHGSRSAQMNGSQVISLLAIMQADVINYINGLPSNFA